MEAANCSETACQGTKDAVKEECTEQQPVPVFSDEDKQKLKAQIDRNVGTAPIKSEFIDYKKVHLLYGVENIGISTQAEAQETKDDQANEQTSEPPSKRSKKKNRGMNKKRPFREKRADASLRLCPRLVYGEACQYGEKCMFSHDTAKLMKEKLADLGPVCYNFDTYGKCLRGIMCRYGSAHISADFQNIVDEEKWNKCKEDSVTTNVLPKDLQGLLRKRKHRYPKSDRYLSGMSKAAKERREKQKKQESASQIAVESEKKEVTLTSSSNGDQSGGMIPKSTQGVDAGGSEGNQTSVQTDSTVSSSVESSKKQSSEKIDTSVPSESGDQDSPVNTTDAEVAKPVVKTGGQHLTEPGQQETSSHQHSSGVVTDEDRIKLRKSEKKAVDFKDKLFLAPLTTVGNLPFRRLCKTFGADITCGEMAICTNLLQGQASEWALLKRHSSEDVFGVQIAGAFPDTMTKCSELLNEQIDINFVDINVGCPIDMVYSKGAGCGLMNRIGRFEEIVRGMDTVLDVPVTVKMRTGVYDKHLVAAKMIPRIYDWGASVVTLHGRTREQRYTKSANWDYIGQCVQAAHPYPLLGNGDILSYEDASLFQEKSGVAGVMIARGALVKPWIFTEIKEQRHWDISSQERYDILQRFVNYGMEHWGSDTEGVEKTRRFLLEWLSFLYRYIPVGILERVPQQINQRPPHYIGRNDLETLMASANFNDWIKISEMLLGPVPENFQFLPKHKANSYS